MKKLIVGLGLAASASFVWANCTTHTYFVNGRMTTCTVCCYGGNCTTSCF